MRILQNSKIPKGKKKVDSYKKAVLGSTLKCTVPNIIYYDTYILGLRVEGTVHNFNISPIYYIGEYIPRVSGRLLRSRNVPL